METAKGIDFGPIYLNILLNFPGEDATSIEETYFFLDSIIKEGASFITNNRFYNMHPGDGIYRDLENWSRDLGTRVYYKDWWKDESTISLGTIIDPSRTLDFASATSIYKEKTRHVHQACMENFKGYSEKMLLLKRIAIEGALMTKRAQYYRKYLST